MSSDETRSPVMECALAYVLSSEKRETVASGAAKALLDAKYLSIVPEFGGSLLFVFSDILGISEEDYKVNIYLSTREKLTLSELGYKYEDFLKTLFRLRNELLLKYMLMEEKLRDLGGEAEFVWNDQEGKVMLKGLCELRLYETALVVLPEKGEPQRIPYSDIETVEANNYTIALSTELGEKSTFYQMGERFEPFRKKLASAMTELSLRVQALVSEILPQANPVHVRKLAALIKEGRAAKKSDVEDVLPDFWVAMEKKVVAVGLGEEYDFLKSISQSDSVCIGIKRGLLGNLSGDYVWFLIPIYGIDKQVGNAVVMEAVAEEDQGKATYFFRITSRREYANYRSIEDLQLEVDRVLKNMNRFMVDINFRREPIYLTDEKLGDPRYEQYRFAVQRLPSLQNLRSLFIGRVMYSSPEQWKTDVMDLLRFNVSTQDDSAKWKRGVD